mmetsp:Transcript_17081/g.53349  ORF Transcript_17081/g.53349 Transcript_17081/m.53349 type:complete len:311 (+) Transcript_17081:69-1001(+)
MSGPRAVIALAAAVFAQRCPEDGDPLDPARGQTRVPVLNASDSSEYIRRIAPLEANAKRKLADRALWIKSSVHGRSFESMPMVGFGWILFSPYWPCLWTLDRGRSSARDGPKWTCGLREIEASRRSNCVVYSFGSRKEVSFERRVVELAPSCEVHVFDRTAPVRPGPNVFYHCIYLAGDGERSLPRIMRSLGHSHIDLLKMDVEATEWPVFANWDPSISVGQLAVEMHLVHSLPPLVTVVQKHFLILETLGFRLVSIEPVGPGTPEEESAEHALLAEDHPGKHQRRGGRPVEAMFLHKAWTPAGFVASLP